MGGYCHESDQFLYWLLYFLFTVAFTYFYTDVMFRQQNLPGDVAETRRVRARHPAWSGNWRHFNAGGYIIAARCF